MSAIAIYRSTIGKKYIMAATGIVLFGFVTGHMLGNLQVFIGRDKFNDYAFFLKHTPLLLWGTRAVLLASVVLHALTATQLTLIQRRARPVGYRSRRSLESTFASRTMYWSGIVLALFIVYHLLHFTIGAVHPHFAPEDPVTGRVDAYQNVIDGFQVLPVAIAYVVAMLALGMHMWHGVWSVWQSLGINTPRTDSAFRKLAIGLTAVVIAGFISIPVAVQAGLIQ